MIPVGEEGHVFDAGADGVNVFDFSGDDVGRIHVAHGRVFPTGHDDRDVFLHRGDDPRVLRVDLVILLELARLDGPPHEFVREIALARGIGGHPFLEDGFLEPPHGLHFGDASVGHAIHVTIEQGLFVSGREIAIVRNAFVVVVGHQIEDVLFEIGAGAGNDGDFVAADHFGEGEPEFPGAHRPGERDEHFAAVVDELAVTVGRIDQRGGVEVAIVVADEIGDGFAHRFRL